MGKENCLEYREGDRTMIKWIDKDLLERKVILQQAAAGEHLPEYAVEKDWWVSMTLKALFQTSCKDYLEFKGLCVAIHNPFYVQ